uniref:non-specific serine/threonine protein kinase n=1 Tax=Kalanchoe fedtschenkoi TaxID=63787 RepID=A0A7N0TS44_KALFE
MVNLVGLYVQENHLSGHVGDLFHNSVTWRVETMNLSGNSFTGIIPRAMGNLPYLTNLDLHGNALKGKIPAEFGNLLQLAYLDLSSNFLSGEIPGSLCQLENLAHLNLSDNRLEGPVLTHGFCSSLSKASLAGNKDHCGSIVGLKCQHKYPRRNMLRLAGAVTGSLLIVIGIVFWLRLLLQRKNGLGDVEEIKETIDSSSGDGNLNYLSSSSKSKEPLSINVAIFEQPLWKLTMADILEGTGNFCKTNVIGDWGFGTVYRAELPDGRTVAIKKLNQGKTQGQREFLTEMETLGKVKHPNLVSLLGYCSVTDEKLLVYEYMAKGSLDLWLRGKNRAREVLDWTRRLKIATGAARGLAFLHHGFIPHIIHRDIKASNILLDEDFEPKVADFGLARLVSACETHVSTDVAGTFGYIPPEYGQSWKSTTRGDVYSLGVIMLEPVTGKEPTGPEFKDIEGGIWSAGWLRRSRSGRLWMRLIPRC